MTTLFFDGMVQNTFDPSANESDDGFITSDGSDTLIFNDGTYVPDDGQPSVNADTEEFTNYYEENNGIQSMPWDYDLAPGQSLHGEAPTEDSPVDGGGEPSGEPWGGVPSDDGGLFFI